MRASRAGAISVTQKVNGAVENSGTFRRKPKKMGQVVQRFAAVNPINIVPSLERPDELQCSRPARG